MREMPGPGEVHRDAGLVRRLDGELVADRAARLDDGLDTGVDEDLRAVLEGEERVGGGHGSGGALPRAVDGEPARVDAVDLTHADADRRPSAGEQDRVGLRRATGLPREREV